VNALSQPPDPYAPWIAVRMFREALAVFRVLDVDDIRNLPDWAEPLPELEGPYSPHDPYPEGRDFTMSGIAGWVFRGAVRRLRYAAEGR
jgi:hypothetical protein